MPRRSRTARRDRADHHGEHRRVRVAGREGQLDAALQLLDAYRDLHKHSPDRLERGAAPARAFRCRPSQRMHQPVGAKVPEQPELVGLPARARRLIGAREALHVLDQVLGIAACAEDLLVERLAVTFEAGDDEADVGAECGRLDAGNELARRSR